MKDIAIYGGGGFGREVACVVRQINDCILSKEEKWNLIGFFDDVLPRGTEIEYGITLGGMDALNSYSSPLNIVFGIGSPKAVSILHSKITNPKITFPNIFDPSIQWLDQDNVQIGIGNVICAQSFVSCNVTIGNFNIINNGVSLGHDCVIGDYNAVMPASRISGGVKIGNRNFIGVNSVVLQYHSIADDITVGAGSVVMKNIRKPGTYVGIPAQKIKF